MFIGAISFLGTLSRKGFLLTLLVCAIGIGLTLAIAAGVIEGPPNMSVTGRDRVIIVVLGIGAIFALTLIGAMIRRLRDAGSGAPYLELLISVAIPGFGWLWLLVRLFLFPSKGDKDQDGDIDRTTDAPTASAPQKQAESNVFARALKAAGTGQSSGAQPRTQSGQVQNTRIVHDEHVHTRAESHTVRRAKRVLGPRARRQIGF